MRHFWPMKCWWLIHITTFVPPFKHVLFMWHMWISFHVSGESCNITDRDPNSGKNREKWRVFFMNLPRRNWVRKSGNAWDPENRMSCLLYGSLMFEFLFSDFTVYTNACRILCNRVYSTLRIVCNVTHGSVTSIVYDFSVMEYLESWPRLSPGL